MATAASAARTVATQGTHRRVAKLPKAWGNSVTAEARPATAAVPAAGAWASTSWASTVSGLARPRSHSVGSMASARRARASKAAATAATQVPTTPGTTSPWGHHSPAARFSRSG